jgi:predicted DNA binding CopG/RHH family protein
MPPRTYELEPKTTAFRVRLSDSLLKRAQAQARRQGVPFARYIRLLIEADLNTGAAKRPTR